MLDRHRAGRTVEALSMFRKARQRGIPLEPQLTELHRRLLCDDPALSGDDEPTWPAPRQLPPAPSDFVGRETELAELDARAAGPVIGVHGLAGVGKTTLVLRWAHGVAAEFRDGQLFVDLRGGPVGEPLRPSQILDRALRALGVPTDEIPSDLDRRSRLYLSLLRQRRVLVVLDNARDTEQVDPLLPVTGSSLVIVTSREPLPDIDSLELGVPGTDQAVALLPSGRRTAELAEQCARLPLALRMVAGIPDVALRPATEPKAALGTVLAEVYRRLGSRQQRLLRVVGGFPAATAGTTDLAVMANLPVDETARLLDELAATGLIETVGPGGWRGHDLVRAFAREQPGHNDSPRDDLRRLLDWYVPATSRANAVAFGTSVRAETGEVRPPEFADAAEALEWLDFRYPSLLGAIRQGAGNGNPGPAAHLASDLFRYFSVHGYIEEWMDVTAVALDAARSAGDRKIEVRLSLNLGYACWDAAKVDEAHRHFQHALTVSQELRDRDSQATVLGVLTGVNITVGRYLRAYEYASVALTMSQSLNNHVSEAIATENLGIVDLLRGNNAQAIRLLERSLSLYRRHKVRLIEPDAHSELARALFRDGDLEKAASHAERSVGEFGDIGDDSAAAWAKTRLGLINGVLGDPVEALDLHRQALPVMLRSPRNEYKSEALNNAGITYTAAGRPDWALEFHHEALVNAQRISCLYEKARALDGIAAAHRAQGERADEYAHRAHELFVRLGAAEARRG